MLNLSRFKPRFWDHLDAASEPGSKPFSFRRKWMMIVAFTTVVTLTPLLIMALVDFRLTRQAFETEAGMAISRALSNSGHSIAFILSQRRAVLTFIARDNSIEALKMPGRLETIREHLQSIMGGFAALNLVDANHRIQARAGSTAAVGILQTPAQCFDQAATNGFFVGDVGENHRLVIAVRHAAENEEFFILQAALNADLFEPPLAQLGLGENNDAFIVNRQGILQTASKQYGRRFEKTLLPLPEAIDTIRVRPARDHLGHPVLMGVAPIAESPFALVMIRQQSDIVDLWRKPRIRLIGFLLFSIALILVSIPGVATYLVNRIHTADQQRVQALHQVEYTNKMASIGRLASGVAHEVNNPLAIINQKTGLIKDLLTLNSRPESDKKLIGLVEDILAAVRRCGAITRRLLDFARHMDTAIEKVDIEAVIRQVLAFVKKEAQRRSIEISVTVRPNLPTFDCDHGNLQQIFLNLVNNAFAAMQDGGRLDISIGRHKAEAIRVVVSDTGHGIPEADLKRVFEPFFSTRQGHAGTGLGLSITYGMVTEMGGTIAAESKVEQGTRFTVTLPLVPPGDALGKSGRQQEASHDG
jgi:signal transduction histidine kinase